MFDAVDTLSWCCPRWPAWSPTLRVRRDRMAAPRRPVYALATDVAEWLVRSGRAVPRGARDHRRAGARCCATRELRAWRGRRRGPRRGRRRASRPSVRAVLSVAGALAPAGAGGTAPAGGRAARRAGRQGAATPRGPGPRVTAGRACSPGAARAADRSQVGPQPAGAVCDRDAAGRWPCRLTEVEAYAGARGPGVARLPRPHAAQRRDVRSAGLVYVYFTYGMHWCVNVVCGPEGRPRPCCCEPVRWSRARRSRPADVRPGRPRELARGPARLKLALGVDGSQDGLDDVEKSTSPTVSTAAGTRGGEEQDDESKAAATRATASAARQTGQRRRR